MKQLTSTTERLTAEVDLLCDSYDDISALLPKYGSSDDIIEALDFEDYEEDVDIENMSLYGYAEGLINGNELDAKVQMDKGLTTFTHEVRVDKTYYTYYVVVYKAETAFWRVEFATRSDSFEDQLDAIRDYAWSVEFE